MKRNFLGFNILLEWGVPEDWFSQINKTKSLNWTQAIKSISLLFLLFIIIFLLEERFVHNFFLILLFSISLALFLFFLEYFLTEFTRSVSSPNVTIFKSLIRVKYWGGSDDIYLEDIVSYKFNRLVINSTEFSVLVLQLKKESTFEIGLPSVEFEKNIKDVLTQIFNIPYFGSYKL